jgi:hypothetical protein
MLANLLWQLAHLHSSAAKLSKQDHYYIEPTVHLQHSNILVLE